MTYDSVNLLKYRDKFEVCSAIQFSNYLFLKDLFCKMLKMGQVLGAMPSGPVEDQEREASSRSMAMACTCSAWRTPLHSRAKRCRSSDVWPVKVIGTGAVISRSFGMIVHTSHHIERFTFRPHLIQKKEQNVNESKLRGFGIIYRGTVIIRKKT